MGAGTPPAARESLEVAEAVYRTLKRVRDAYEDSHGEDFGAWLRDQIDDAQPQSVRGRS